MEGSESRDKRSNKVDIVDLRGKVNIFELMGPKSTQVIKGALKPILGGESKELNQVSSLPSFSANTENTAI